MATTAALFSPILDEPPAERGAGGNPLRIWRKRRGLALSDIGRETGLSAEWLAKVEANHRSMNDDQRKMVAKALGVHPVELDGSFFASAHHVAEAA